MLLTVTVIIVLGLFVLAYLALVLRYRSLRRKHFYLENGMTPMGVMVRLFGVPMELLGFDCRITYPQYRDFYLQSMGPWAAEHIESLPWPAKKEWE